MARQMAAEGTHLRFVQDLVADAYHAMSGAGSNDAEHDVLIDLVDFAEDEIRKMGGDLPAHPDYPDEDEEEN